MAGDNRPGDASFGHDQGHPDRQRRPASLSRDKRWNQTRPSIERGQEILQVDDLRLDFDDQQCPAGGVPGQDVHRALLAEVVEGVFGDALPAERFQDGHDLFDQRGVTCVQQTIKLAASPTQVDHCADLENGAQASQGSDRDMVELPPLDPGNDRLAQPCRRCHVRLPQAAAAANSPNHSADLEVIHAQGTRTRVACSKLARGRSSATYRRLIRPLCPPSPLALAPLALALAPRPSP